MFFCELYYEPFAFAFCDQIEASSAGSRETAPWLVGVGPSASGWEFAPCIDPKHPPPCARWPGALGSWLVGHCFWVLVWTGACYWHGVGGFVFNLSSSTRSAPAIAGFDSQLPKADLPTSRRVLSTTHTRETQGFTWLFASLGFQSSVKLNLRTTPNPPFSRKCVLLATSCHCQLQ